MFWAFMFLDMEALDPRRWSALGVVLSASFLVVLDFFIVNISIPTIRASLNASFGEVELVIAAYALAYAVGLITGGRLGDIYGRKRLFLIGVSSFAVASLVCGVARTAPALVVGRVLQGLSASVMVPQVLSIIRVSFPAEERGRAFGYYGTALGLASITGPLVGGLLLRLNLFGLSWRPIFLVNLPVAAWALWAASRLVRESRAPKPLRLDLIGVALVSCGLLLLMVPLVLAPEQRWPPWAFIALGAAVPVLAFFVWFEREKTRRDGSPLLELSLFGYPSFRTGLAVTLVFFTGLSAFFLTLALFLEAGLGLRPLQAGLMFAPFAVGFVASSNLAGPLIERTGRVVLQWGSLCMAAGLTVLTLLIHWRGTTLDPLWMVPALLLYGFGQGFVVPASIYLVLGSIPSRDAGSASGVLATTQQVALAFGVALIGGFFFSLLGDNAAPEGFVRAFPTALRLNLAILAVTFLLVYWLPAKPVRPVEIAVEL